MTWRSVVARCRARAARGVAWLGGGGANHLSSKQPTSKPPIQRLTDYQSNKADAPDKIFPARPYPPRQTDAELFREVIDEMNSLYGPMFDYDGKLAAIAVDNWPRSVR